MESRKTTYITRPAKDIKEESYDVSYSVSS